MSITRKEKQASMLVATLTTDIVSELIMVGFSVADPKSNPINNYFEGCLYGIFNAFTCITSHFCVPIKYETSRGEPKPNFLHSFSAGVGNVAINLGIMWATESILPAWSVPLITAPVFAACIYGIPALSDCFKTTLPNFFNISLPVYINRVKISQENCCISLSRFNLWHCEQNTVPSDNANIKTNESSPKESSPKESSSEESSSEESSSEELSSEESSSEESSYSSSDDSSQSYQCEKPSKSKQTSKSGPKLFTPSPVQSSKSLKEVTVEPTESYTPTLN